jgi:hypothetical protein
MIPVVMLKTFPWVLKIAPFIRSYKIWVAILICLLSAYGGYRYAENTWKVKYSVLDSSMKDIEIMQAKLIAENKELEKRSAETTTRVITKYVDRVKVVKEKSEEILKEVPVYVTKNADDNCTIPDGWVYIHNKAASGSAKVGVPEAPGNPDASTTNIRLSDASRTITINYQKYYELVEQLTSLQQWITEQQRVYNNK